MRKATDEDDDLLTLMWERSSRLFSTATSISRRERARSRVDGARRAEGEDPVAGAGRSRARVDARRRSRSSTTSTRRSTSSTTSEVEYLQQEIKREFSTDLRPAVIASLLDTFETQKDPTVREEICGLLDYFLLILLSTAQYRNAAYLLREAGVTANARADVARAAEAASHAARRADERSRSRSASCCRRSRTRRCAPPQMELDELFGILQPRALETILGWIGRSTNPQLKMLLEVAAVASGTQQQRRADSPHRLG